jgi:hypothetical protein
MDCLVGGETVDAASLTVPAPDSASTRGYSSPPGTIGTGKLDQGNMFYNDGHAVRHTEPNPESKDVLRVTGSPDFINPVLISLVDLVNPGQQHSGVAPTGKSI